MPRTMPNPDRNFSTDGWGSGLTPGFEPESDLDRMFADPEIRERIAQLISCAMRKSARAGE